MSGCSGVRKAVVGGDGKGKCFFGDKKKRTRWCARALYEDVLFFRLAAATHGDAECEEAEERGGAFWD